MKFVIPTPQPKQRECMLDKHHDIAYGGARGGGKSWTVRTLATIYALGYKRIKILIVRRTYPELINNHINPLLETLHDVADYNKQEKVFKFVSTGSTISFGFCNNDNDVMRYQGAEYDIIFLDEASQLKEEWIDKIRVCCRGTNNLPKRIYYMLNPGGASHAYFKRLFIDRIYKDGENPDDYSFHQALVTDNDALMQAQPDYIKTLEALPPKLRRAWLDGDWNIFEGQFFEDFVPDPPQSTAEEEGTTVAELRRQHRYCHVIEPFEPDTGWNILRSYDFGYGKPFSCAWWALDYNGTLYRILELYGCTETPNEGVKWTPDEQAKKIAEIEDTHPWLRGRKITGVADPAIWDASRGESIADTFAKYRVYFTPGDHKRIPGWMQVHYRFQFDENGYARMYIFNNCKAFIRTMPLLMYDEHDVEDIDTTLEDHVADEVRYLCMSRPIKPIIPVKEKTIFVDPLDQFKETKRWTR